MQVYHSGDYMVTYGRSLHQLVGEWRGFLDRLTVSDDDRDAVDALFRRSSIFGKVCARVTAERNRLAGRKFAQREYAAAAALYAQSYSEGKGYEALSGQVVSTVRNGDPLVAVSALDSIIVKDDHPGQYLPLFVTIGDAYWMLHNKQQAAALYRRVRRADLSERLNEAATIRLLALKDTSIGDRLLPYFGAGEDDSVFSSVLDSLQRSHPANVLLSYLQGRALVQRKNFQESLELLSRRIHEEKGTALVEDDEMRFLEALRLRMLGYALFRLTRFQEARAAFWTSLNYLSTQVALNQVNDWVERCEWMEQHGPR
jgi:tetratricopeptide (TPR) repeat protein